MSGVKFYEHAHSNVMWTQAIHCSSFWQKYCKNIILAYITIHLRMLKNTFINLPRKVKETHGYTIYKRNWCIRKDRLKTETQIDAAKLLQSLLTGLKVNTGLTVGKM